MNGWEPGARRNLVLLWGCWALATTGNVLLVSVSALSGHLLAADKALAMLPVALQWLSTATAAVPASFLMARIGRRGGFMLGCALGGTGAALAATALYRGSFALLCLGTALMGAYNGFNWYYRFAAGEAAPEHFRSRAISLVLAGGVVAALIGPTLARASKDLLEPHIYAGSFTVYLLISMLILLLLQFIRLPLPQAAQLRGGRPLGEIVRQPVYAVAVTGGVVSYGVMVLLMSVTPLAMRLHHHPFDDATFVIQWHVLGMYAPAFFTGHLIRWFGVIRMMLAGGAIMATCSVIALTGDSVTHFWVALALLGVGWNFLFVSSTTLLAETVAVAERAKAQAFNEFLVFGCVGLATFLSGTLLHHYGWFAVNLAALPLILIVIGATLGLAVRRARATA